MEKYLVKGNSISKGYYKNKKDTEKAFEKGWFKTGDIGNIDKGYLFITGKKNDIIITSDGENISPTLIEHNIKKLLPDFEYVLVTGNNKQYLTVLLFPDSNQKVISKYEQYNNFFGPNETFKISQENEDDISKSDEFINLKQLHDSISDKISEINKLAPNSHKIKKWMILIDNFKIGEEVTPTHKLKRSYLYKKFEKEINVLYKD